MPIDTWLLSISWKTKRVMATTTNISKRNKNTSPAISVGCCCSQLVPSFWCRAISSVCMWWRLRLAHSSDIYFHAAIPPHFCRRVQHSTHLMRVVSKSRRNPQTRMEELFLLGMSTLELPAKSGYTLLPLNPPTMSLFVCLCVYVCMYVCASCVDPLYDAMVLQASQVRVHVLYHGTAQVTDTTLHDSDLMMYGSSESCVCSCHWHPLSSLIIYVYTSMLRQKWLLKY